MLRAPGGQDFPGPDEVEFFDAFEEQVGDVRHVGSAIERLQVTADRDRARLGEPDGLLLPGGRETPGFSGDTALLRTLREAEARGAWLTSVCTGALVLAAAGLLDEARAHRGSPRRALRGEPV